MGKPLEFLQAQIAEKEARIHEARAADVHSATEAARVAGMVEAQERDAARAIRDSRRETLRVIEQQVKGAGSFARETADLNLKHRVRAQDPLRRGSDDPRLGPASLQVFEGEDTLIGVRTTLQRQQQGLWIRQQIEEKEAAARAAAEEER